jgi:3-hydroxyacyl-CoA dehydrogenase
LTIVFAALRIFVKMASKIKSITVFGSGLMGAGIAQVAAQTGHKVVLVDVSDQILAAAKKRIQDSVTKVAAKAHANDAAKQKEFIAGTIGRITTTTDKKKAVSGDCDLVMEAIREQLEDKQQLFGEIDKYAPPNTLFATNTSSLRLFDISKVIKRKTLFGGMHFFNPVPMMKLVEVVREAQTSDETHQRMLAFGRALEKTAISCKDTPGFVVNRLLVPYMFEAYRMVERGDASKEDVDIGMKLGCGYPMGPFTLSDVVGNDTMEHIIQQWHPREPDNPLFNPSPMLTKLVKEGKLGMKSGDGFYSYKKKK